MLVNDVHKDPRYLGVVPGINAQLVVPLRHKKRVMGALNLLSDRAGAFTERDENILAQFGVHVAQALANARMFEQEREHTETLETLTEIAREVGAILDLDELLHRIAILTKRLISYRTFGILLFNESRQQLEPKVALQYGEKTSMLNIKIGEGLVGYSMLHKVPVLVNDVSQDPRYIPVVNDVRSELVIPLMVKERCLGVFDLESPELNAFTPRHVEILGILASQAAVAIENARLYEAVRENELRLEREIDFARRVQTALLPAEAPRKLKGVEVAARFQPAGQIGGDVYDFLSPDPSTLVIAVDPRLSLPRNADRLFEKARRAERAARRLEERLRETRRALTEARREEEAVGAARNAADLPAPPVAPPGDDPRAGAGPRTYLTTRGLTLLVGRGARDNQQLTFASARPDDWWLHARDVPGAHVVLRDPEGRATDADRREAAEVAAFFSAQAREAQADVHVTRRRNVRPGGAPGRVRVLQSETLRVPPRDPEGRLRRR